MWCYCLLVHHKIIMTKKKGRQGSSKTNTKCVLTPGFERGLGGYVYLVNEDLALQHAAANGYEFDRDKYRPSSVKKRSNKPTERKKKRTGNDTMVS
jgi:hypothetical protein